MSDEQESDPYHNLWKHPDYVHFDVKAGEIVLGRSW